MDIGGNLVLDLARDSYADLAPGDVVPRQGAYPEKFTVVEVHRDQQLKLAFHEPSKTLLALCRGTAKLGDWVQDMAAAAHVDFVANEEVFFLVDRAAFRLKAEELVIVGHSLGGWLGFNLHGRVSMPVRSFLFEPYVPGILAFLRYHHGMEVYASAHDPVVNGLVGNALVHYRTHAFHSRRAKWHIMTKPEPEWKFWQDVTKFVNHSLDQWRLPAPDPVSPSIPVPPPKDPWPDFGPGRGDGTWPDFGPGREDGTWPDFGPGRGDGTWPDFAPGREDGTWPDFH